MFQRRNRADLDQEFANVEKITAKLKPHHQVAGFLHQRIDIGCDLLKF